MAAFFKKKSKKRNDKKAKPVKKDAGRAADSSETTQYLESSRLVENGLFIIFTALIVIISFLGQKPKEREIILNQAAPNRIVAEYPFTYQSNIQLQEQIRAVRAQVPPVYKRTLEPFDNFKSLLNKLSANIARTQIEFEDEGEDIVDAEIQKTAAALISESGIDVDLDYLMQFKAQTVPKERASLYAHALVLLKTLYDDGIYSPQAEGMNGLVVTVIQFQDESGQSNLPNARAYEDALVDLRVWINGLSRDKETARILFEIFRPGLKANLVYSESGTLKATDQAIAQLEAPTLNYEEGDTLIDPGAIVDEQDIERLNAYKLVEAEYGGESLFLNQLFLERLIMTFALMLAVYIYVRQGLWDIYKRNRAIAITALSILINLIIIRLIIEIGGIASNNNQALTGMLPYFAPYALAPILIAVLIGASPAILSSLIIAVIFCIVQNNSIQFLLVTFLSGVVGSYVSTNIRKRSRLVRAGLLAGVTTAVLSIFINWLEGYSLSLIGQQVLIALIVGMLTGIVAVGLLPLLEQLFKITTDITLLELTDFNHPLLRRMQMEAPGTYHHSLMVANLSENAAAKIGASPLLCRVCSFFHDIGKLVKPEYFVENQRGGINPHDHKNPSMSALVIKAHVKEGVELAKKNKLPRVIIDVIRQHHGTSLIQYFYYQAQQKKQNETTPPINTKNTRPPVALKVDESTYRYDGPRPAFKESAIIFFADSLEAASRSLKKVSQPAIEELIDKIFKDKIEDGQLDECPLTFKELDQIRSSFTYTLLNMLHSRVEYPKDKTSSEETNKANTDSSTNANDSNRSQQPV